MSGRLTEQPKSIGNLGQGGSWPEKEQAYTTSFKSNVRTELLLLAYSASPIMRCAMLFECRSNR
jgi:hypothetical protein